MSFYSVVKFSIGLFVLIGAGLMVVGAVKLWGAYDFYSHSKQVPGIFKGYHNEEHLEKFRDSNGYTSYRNVSEYFPMFVYQDDRGRTRHVTAEESHFFRYLSYDDKVDVLLRTDHQETPRLGGIFGLYGSSIVTMVFAGIFIYLPMKALNFADRWLNSGRDDAAAKPIKTQILNRADDAIHIGDLFLYLFILLGLFALGAGALWYFTAPDRESQSATPSVSDFLQVPPSKSFDKASPGAETSTVITKNVYQQLGSSRLYDAARRGDHETVKRLLATGERIYDIRPAAVQTLIRKNDEPMLELIFADGFDLTQHYARQTFGDQAVAEGRSDIVRLINRHQGLFEAPPAFVALAAEDSEALNKLLKETNPELRFRGMTLQRYAQRYRKQALLDQETGSEKHLGQSR